MTSFTTVQRLLTLPAHAAAAAAGTSAGLLATGVQRVSHLLGRTVGHVADTAAPSGPWPAEKAPRVDVPPTPAEAPVAEDPTPEDSTPEDSTPELRVAPSAQAAVLAPALGLSEAEVEELTGDDHQSASDAPRSEDG